MVKCYHCGNLGYLKKNCRSLSSDDRRNKKSSQPAAGQHKTSVGQHSMGECDALVIEHVLQAGVMGNRIVDSGATCHMCHDEILFSELQLLEKETDVTLDR